MGLSIKNIKKWWKMIRGKSILHVNQGIGKCYSFDNIRGYYNDLTEKVLFDKKNYNSLNIVKSPDVSIYFPIAIFQYGLACYDLYLMSNKDQNLMLLKFLEHVKWAFENQDDNGSWNNFGDRYPHAPYSSMAQGEGASLLIRGYIYTNEKKYLFAAKKAIDFMLKPRTEGGTSDETNKELILYEFTCFPYVYNGWIFSIFGLIDYVIVTHDEEIHKKLDKTINTLCKKIPDMNNGYWSMYRNDKTIASPFYHHLHIAQLKVLGEYTRNQTFSNYAYLFEKYENNKKNKRKAFVKKSIQKIFSK